MTKATADAGVSVRLVAIADLTPNPRNARTHPEDQVNQIAASMREFGFTNPILADLDDDAIIAAGHGRRLAALKLIEAGEEIRLPNGRILPAGMVPVIDCGGWSENQRRAYTLADNRLAETSEWDEELLKLELVFLQEDGFALDLTGFDTKSLDKLLADPDDPKDQKAAANATLAERFGLPPFSVLNAREGWWQERKRAWLALGIQSEVGRGDNLISRSLHDRLQMIIPGHYNDTVAFIDAARLDGLTDDEIVAAAVAKHGGRKAKNGKRMAATLGQDIMKGEVEKLGKGLAYGTAEWVKDKGISGNAADTAGAGTSIFDPVVCELAYRWFSPAGGVVLDPFAGGSVRGIVASKLGRQYVGGELRAEQVVANRNQAAQICRDPAPIWNIGDSREIQTTCAGTLADFIFSCPPYADLEVYSDDPQDNFDAGLYRIQEGIFRDHRSDLRHAEK